MEVVDIAHKINEKIGHLQTKAKQLDKLADIAAVRQAEYDKTLAITMMKLRNGKGMELDGEFIKNPSVSVTEKVAKGMCWKEKIASDIADTEYRNCLKKIDVIKTQLNGFQSINKHLSEM